jgi:hypothetical protein
MANPSFTFLIQAKTAPPCVGRSLSAREELSA